LRFVRPEPAGDLDLLALTGRFRFLISAREPCESASEDEYLRRRSLTGLTDGELLGDRRQRRGGVRERERERERGSLGGGELDLCLPSGVTDRGVYFPLRLRGDGDWDFESKDGERRARRGGGDLE
jgi:hypothetical protein